jgi:hypothetical protein
VSAIAPNPLVNRLWPPLQRHAPLLFAFALAVYTAAVAREAFVRAPGPHDNDWPLLMWLAKHASTGNLAPLAVGHYGFLQIVLVRILSPLLGSTLIAAKALNIAGTVGAGYAAFTLGRYRGLGWGIAAFAAFLLTPIVYLTAQSEFGDPLALALFTGGLALFFDAPLARRLFMGGLLIGLSGAVRLHFQTFAWAALLPLGVYLGTVRRSGYLAAGVLVGQLPTFALNWVVHQTLFSPIARGFIGQVVVGGTDAYDMPATHMLHPMSEVLASHKMALLSVIADRLLECPPVLAIALAIALLARDRRIQTLWLLGVGYYVGFVTPSWGLTPRLLEPFIFFVTLSAVLAIAHITPGRLHAIAANVCIALACLNLRLAKGHLRAERQRIHDTWERNAAVERLLRAHGMTDAREAFATDWFTHPVSDPDFIPYYNFGFWNLLVPEFAAERPNPYPLISTPDAFFAFLSDHGVRYLVLGRDAPLGGVTPADFTAIGNVQDQLLFAK